MTASSSYPDPDPDPLSDKSVFQNSVYIGANVQDILYGMLLLLYFNTMQVLVTRSKSARKKSDIFYALFSSTMMFLATVWLVTQIIFGEEMWLLQNDYPGGSNAYWKNNISAWYMDWGTTAIIVLQLMTDGLMIYRCRVIWNSYRVTVVPVVLWLSTLTLGFFVDWVTSLPGGNFFTGVAYQLGIAYYTVSVFLNTTLTCLICYRMLRYGKEVQEGLGREYASSYFTVVTIVIESVAPYTLSGIAFLATMGVGSPTSVAFFLVYVLMMCISPQMLILRAIKGTAWNKDTCMLQGSTLKFNPMRTSMSQSLDHNVTEGPVHLQTLSNVHIPDGHDSKPLVSQV